tara:strand:+ start:240 stop:743 length:504 start_codon:yes stop_codon:yes gene_type:complete
MGLDQYLRRKTSTHSFWFMQLEGSPKVEVFDVPGVDETRIIEIVEEVGYWRKCPAIHNWFVETVQDGVDECEEHEVSKGQLTELLEICKEIWEFYKKNSNNHEQPNEKAKEFAEEKLPNVSGFFFGNQEYDKDYFEWQIQPTIEMLEDLLNEESSKLLQVYTYRSSW